MEKCKICNKEFNSTRSLSNHIWQVHNMTAKEYYDEYIKEPGEEFCNYCSKNKTPFISLAKGYQKYCCAECSGKGSSKQGKQTMLAKYGTKGICNPEKTKKRYKEYSPADLQNIINKGQLTREQHYGSVHESYVAQAQKTKEKAESEIKSFEALNDCTYRLSLIEKYGQGWYKSQIITDYLEDNFNRHYVKNTDISKIIEYQEINKYNQRSHIEEEIYLYIKSICDLPIQLNTRDILENLELDIYIPDLKLGIEVNGNYWHSDLNRPKNYHELKSKKAELLGIRLIHIYEFEWLNLDTQKIIKSILRSACGNNLIKIPARLCSIKQITNSEAKQFCTKNHLQGYRNAKVIYGLFYNDKLVQMMSFSQSKYNKNIMDQNSWEIIRSCTELDTTIIGGINKLFKHFILENNPKEIFSYCDFNKFNGKGYEALGMELIGYTGPNFWWLLPGNEVVNRNPSKNNELKQLARGKLYGAGSKKYKIIL